MALGFTHGRKVSTSEVLAVSGVPPLTRYTRSGERGSPSSSHRESVDVARLDVVLIGNAAPALQGAPVTTLDFDFMFRKTPTNMRKLKVFAQQLGAVILRPYTRRRAAIEWTFSGRMNFLRVRIPGGGSSL